MTLDLLDPENPAREDGLYGIDGVGVFLDLDGGRGAITVTD